MKDRIKCIRKEKNMTQTAFGDRIGVKGNTVTNYEKGLRVPSDAVIKMICQEFQIREEWLKFGKGQMHKELSRKEELQKFVGDVMGSEEDDIRVRFISALCKLNVDEWELIEKIARKIANDEKEADR